jgi:segregation and condensation protein B
MPIMRIVRDEPMSEEEQQQEELAAAEAERRRQTEQEDGPVEADPDDANAEAGAEEGPAASAVDLPALEALLFSTHHPLTGGRLAELLELESTKPLRKAIKALNAQYEEAGRAFRIEQVAGGYQMLTLPEYGEYLKKLHQKEADAKLSKSALETLAIIAYKQPISRAQIGAIRGVDVDGVVRTLQQRGYVAEVGRDPGPGQAILLGTTPELLERLGLDTLDDLPPLGDFVPGPAVVEALEHGLRPPDAEVGADVSQP